MLSGLCKKSLLTTCLVLPMLSSSLAFSQEKRVGFLDKMMFTINPQVQTEGPIFVDSEVSKRQDYTSEVFKIILSTAHEKAKSYLEAGDTQGYYAFMVLGMTVPLQEGLYMHFRETTNDGTLCNPDANEGMIIGEAAKTTKEHFDVYLKSGEVPFLADCEKVSDTPVLKQIIRGHDGSDMGMMQVSLRWHYDDFLANRKYESVQRSVEYGLNFIMQGYRQIYRNASDYSCLTTFFLKNIKYENLIRGAWAGKYNSGNIRQTCRISDRSSPYRGHDEHFEENLQKVLSFPETGEISVFSDFTIKLNADVKAAVVEVIENFKNESNKRQAIEKILK